MLIFSLFLMESYLSPAKHRYLGWMARLSVCVESSSSHSKYVWGGGRIQHHMTSDLFWTVLTCVSMAPINPYCSYVWDSLLLLKHTGGVPNELVQNSMSLLWGDFQNGLSFLFFVWSATDSWSWIGALSLIGRRLTCLLVKNPNCWASLSLLNKKERFWAVQWAQRKKNTWQTPAASFVVSVVRL